MEQLNILTTPRADLEAAFELLEGDRSMLQPCNQDSPECWCRVYREFEKERAEMLATLTKDLAEAVRAGERQGDFNFDYASSELGNLKTGRNGGLCRTIYGSGGWNRYYVRANGDIEFSTFHQVNERKWHEAKELGFRVCALEKKAA